MSKSSTQQPIFSVGDDVVYPSHGVGKITAEELEVIAGQEMRLYVISFINDKMILRVPISRAIKTGLRHLSPANEFESIMDILKSKARAAKGMWSKRAQEYESKINSGILSAIAEVLRDLHKNAEDPNRSYSERLIYESALDRLATEYSAAVSTSKEEISKKIVEVLNIAKEEYSIATM